MKPDRRQRHRMRLAFTVLVDGPRGIFRCVAHDISSTGLFIESQEPYPIGTVLRVIFSLPDGTWEMTSRCEVRRAACLRGPLGVVQGLGLGFLGVELEADDLCTIARREHA